MMRLPHRLFRSDDVSNPDGSTSLGGGAKGATREGVMRRVAWWSMALVILVSASLHMKLLRDFCEIPALKGGPNYLGYISLGKHPNSTYIELV
jgi:hypothetical protein